MSEAVLPIVIVPLTFLFVLLIILIAKSPKAGAWVVGGLLLLAPLFFFRFAATGAFRHEEAIPLFVVPATFLFVLMVVLLAKSPKIGIGLIVAIIVMVMAGLFLVPIMTFRQAVPATVSSSTTMPFQPESVDQGTSWAVASPAASPSPKPAPIWSEGVEQELEADVYPSSLAAARALGRRMIQPIRTVAGDPNGAITVILFQEGYDLNLLTEFGQAIKEYLPRGGYSIEANLRNIRLGEVGLTFHVTGPLRELLLQRTGPGRIELPAQEESTTIAATAFAEGRNAGAQAQFIKKPWLEDFGPYASRKSDQAFIIARSNGTCTNESEANQQALDDARARISETLGRRDSRWLAQLAQSPISTMDVLNGGFIVDRFVQSFNTSGGKVWRQADLIDVSAANLAQLTQRKAWEAHSTRLSWARMALSVVGVLVLISVIYFFLNMATRGYYEWSLRIAGVVLAVVAIVSILMIVH